ncbi:uncharacterized protein [Drosophila kikkawai]|uniref:Uncharacterized protein n=1 Tax=Drosophila kikkawai TaxID=30033 RepID=A0ABM4GHC7_DROKI
MLEIWCDWKATIRKKLAKNKAEIRATGGGPYSQLAISEVEEEIAKLCGLYGVDGPAYGVPPTMKHELDQGSEEETEEPAEAPSLLNTYNEPKPKHRRPNPAASLDLQSMCEAQLNIISQLNSSMT